MLAVDRHSVSVPSFFKWIYKGRDKRGRRLIKKKKEDGRECSREKSMRRKEESETEKGNDTDESRQK